jgi:hypothetical protein
MRHEWEVWLGNGGGGDSKGRSGRLCCHREWMVRVFVSSTIEEVLGESGRGDVPIQKVVRSCFDVDVAPAGIWVYQSATLALSGNMHDDQTTASSGNYSFKGPTHRRK